MEEQEQAVCPECGGESVARRNEWAYIKGQPEWVPELCPACELAADYSRDVADLDRLTDLEISNFELGSF